MNIKFYSSFQILDPNIKAFNSAFLNRRDAEYFDISPQIRLHLPNLVSRTTCLTKMKAKPTRALIG